MADSAYLFPFTRAVLVIVFSYLIGSLPMGLIVARISAGIDIREHGSGNIGLTNVIRTLGWGPGLVTGVLDFLKGYLPVMFTLTTFDPQTYGVAAIYEAIVIMVCAALVFGNMYPVYLLFKGGKGVATGLGVMSALMGVYIFIPLAVFGLILLIFRFVSLASIFAAVCVPLTVLLLSDSLPFMVSTPESPSAFSILSAFTWVTALVIIWRHRSNVKRIIAGREPRIGKLKEPTTVAQADEGVPEQPETDQPDEEPEELVGVQAETDSKD